jgi:hypothetical protein
MRIYSKLILGKTEAAHPGYLGSQDTFVKQRRLVQ